MSVNFLPARRAVAETVAIAGQALRALLALFVPSPRPKQDEPS